MFSLKSLLRWDVASFLERAKKFEQIGKLDRARQELEDALAHVAPDDTRQREEITALLDGIGAKQKEDAAALAQQALARGDHRQARYYLNVALSGKEEGTEEYQALVDQLNVIPEGMEEAEIEDDLEAMLRAEVGADFLDRQRKLEFWKSGFPPYKEDYYFTKALTSEVVQSLAAQVEQHPDDPDACFNFGVTLAQMGLSGKALDQIRHYVDLKPEDCDGHYFLAHLLADEGETGQALREFEKTIGLDPEFLEAYYYLAELCAESEEIERAEKLYRQIIEKGANLELAEEAQSKLARLRPASDAASK